MGILQARITGVGCHALLQGSSLLGMEPGSPALAGEFLTASTTWEAWLDDSKSLPYSEAAF